MQVHKANWDRTLIVVNAAEIIAVTQAYPNDQGIGSYVLMRGGYNFEVRESAREVEILKNAELALTQQVRNLMQEYQAGSSDVLVQKMYLEIKRLRQENERIRTQGFDH